jgi:hypothetical protein
MQHYTGGNPPFAVTAAPVTPDRLFSSINVICDFLFRLDLDVMRMALSKKGYARGISWRRGAVQMDVVMMTDPLDFGIFVGFHGGANIVRISPESFDLKNEQQELIYQKCVGMLEIFSTAPTRRSGPSRWGTPSTSTRTFIQGLRSSAAEKRSTSSKLP